MQFIQVLAHLSIGVQVKFQNGSLWSLGGHYKLYNSDHSSLIVEHDIDNNGYWNYIDVNDVLTVGQQFQADLYSSSNPALYIWGMTQMSNYDGTNVYDMHVQDEIVQVSCQDSQSNPIPALHVSIQYPGANNVETNFTLTTDSNGIVNLYMRDKFSNWNGNEMNPVYVVDPNGNYVPYVTNVSMQTGTTQVYATLVQYQKTTVTVKDGSNNLLQGATVTMLDASGNVLDTELTGSNGQIVLKWSPPTDQSKFQLIIQMDGYYDSVSNLTSVASTYSKTLTSGTFLKIIILPQDESGNAISGFNLKLMKGTVEIFQQAITNTVQSLKYQEDTATGNLVVGASLIITVVDTSETYMNDSFTFSYTTNMTKTITLRKYYYAAVTVKDQSNNPVQGIIVSIYGTSSTATTDSTGKATVILTGYVTSGQQYIITFSDPNYVYASQNSTQTFSGDVVVPMALTTQFQISLKVQVLDSQNNIVAGALVTLTYNNQTITSATADSNGIAQFKWGVEEYPLVPQSATITVTATLNGVVIAEQTTTLSQQAQVDLKQSDNNSSQVGLIVGVVIAAVVVVAAAILVPIFIIKRKIYLVKKQKENVKMIPAVNGTDKSGLVQVQGEAVPQQTILVDGQKKPEF